MACVAYLSCINLALEKHEAPAKVQKRRAREGKPPILPYYTVVVAPGYRGQEEADGLGSKHGFRYDVRGRALYHSDCYWVATTL